MIGGRSALLAAGAGLGYGNWTGNYENVSLLLRNGASILVPVDESPTPKAITAFGNAGMITTTFKYGGSSLVFDGGGDHATIPFNAGFEFGTGDFTVEGWFYFVDLNTISKGIVALGDGWNGSGPVTNSWSLRYLGSEGSNQIEFSRYDGTTVFQYTTTGVSVTPNSWHHIAVCRGSGILRIFFNGVSYCSASNAVNYSVINISNPLRVALQYYGPQTGYNGPRYWNGFIDDLRITKGVARYTSNFTPPAAELPANATDDPSYNSVSLLLRNGAPNGAPILVPADESPTPKMITVTGNAGISTTTFKYGDSSLVFDGGGDYLSTTYLPGSYDWWTSDFTAEAWVYANSWAGWSNNLSSAMLVHGSPAQEVVYWGFGPTAQGALKFYWFNNGTYSVQTSNLIPTGSWNHIAMVRTSEGIRLFINGEDPVGPRAQPVLGTNSTSYPLLVGASAGAFANGFIDDFRITKGVARYTKNFLPPPAELPAI